MRVAMASAYLFDQGNLKFTFFTLSILNKSIGSVRPTDNTSRTKRAVEPLCIVFVSKPLSAVSMNRIKPSMVRYAMEPGTRGITAGMEIISGGTWLWCANGMLAKPTADAAIQDANIIPNPHSPIIANLIRPAKNPQSQTDSSADLGVLKSTANPRAAQPHQKALATM